MRVIELFNPNQAKVDCPTCGRETLYQKTEIGRWFCSNDFRRTHVVEHTDIFPPEPKAVVEKPKSTPTIEPVPEERPTPMDTILSRRAEIVAKSPDLAYLQPWTVRVGGGRSVCRSCNRPSHYKPGDKCGEPRHTESYLFSLRSKAEAHLAHQRERKESAKNAQVSAMLRRMEKKAGLHQSATDRR